MSCSFLHGLHNNINLDILYLKGFAIESGHIIFKGFDGVCMTKKYMCRGSLVGTPVMNLAMNFRAKS